MSEKGVDTLESFASKTYAGGSKEAWWKRNIPEDLLEQIMASEVGSAVVAKWLLSLGIEGATKSRCETLTRYRNEQRG